MNPILAIVWRVGLFAGGLLLLSLCSIGVSNAQSSRPGFWDVERGAESASSTLRLFKQEDSSNTVDTIPISRVRLLRDVKRRIEKEAGFTATFALTDTPAEKAAGAISSTSSTVKDIQTAQSLVVAQPSNVRAWRELARQYQAAGESDNAIRAYQEALRLEPSDVDTLEALGALYARAGQKSKVRETWESLAKIDKSRAEKFFATYFLP